MFYLENRRCFLNANTIKQPILRIVDVTCFYMVSQANVKIVWYTYTTMFVIYYENTSISLE